jgi:hypothetical protein
MRRKHGELVETITGNLSRFPTAGHLAAWCARPRQPRVRRERKRAPSRHGKRVTQGRTRRRRPGHRPHQGHLPCRSISPPATKARRERTIVLANDVLYQDLGPDYSTRRLA